MKTYEIKELTSDDLRLRLKEEYESLENLRFQRSTGQLENFKSIQNTKKLIAKIHTILKERDSATNKAK
jgi:large subunit ribosomal protein L29